MRKFIKRFLITSFTFVIILLLIAEIPISDEAIIAITKNTSYQKIAWNIRKLQQHKDLDSAIIFTGPSLVQSGIDDSILVKKGIRAVNMGFNHTGADMEHYFIERILKVSQPKKIFVFRGKHSVGIMHPMIALVMSPSKYIRTFKQFPPQSWFTYISKRVYFVFTSFYYSLFPSEDYSQQMYGMINVNTEGVKSLRSDSAAYQTELSLRASLHADSIGYDGSLFTTNTPRFYWRKFRQKYVGSPDKIRYQTLSLIAGADVIASEIYIPVYNDAVFDEISDDHIYYLRSDFVKVPCVVLPDYKFLSNEALWFDYHHLNAKGSAIFTDSLARYIK